MMSRGRRKRRDAVLEHAADDVERLEDGHVGAVADEVGGGGEAGGAGAADGDLAELSSGEARRHGRLRRVALSPTKRSRRPMPTDSTFLLITHCASHCDSCGQTRPQIEGKMFASLDDRERAVEVAHDEVRMKRGMSI